MPARTVHIETVPSVLSALRHRVSEGGNEAKDRFDRGFSGFQPPYHCIDRLLPRISDAESWSKQPKAADGTLPSRRLPLSRVVMKGSRIRSRARPMRRSRKPLPIEPAPFRSTAGRE